MRNGYSTTNPRRNSTSLSLVERLYRDKYQQEAEYSRFVDNARCLVEPKGYCALSSAKAGVSITGDWYRLRMIRLRRAFGEKLPKYKQ